MQKYTKQVWADARDPVGSTYEDIDLDRCEFKGCSLGDFARHPSQRTLVRRVRATNCIVNGCAIGPALFEDVHISNLRTSNRGGWMDAALFKHVTLSGKIGELVLASWRWLPISVDPIEERRAETIHFMASEAAFYASIDWALDISKAEFKSLAWRLEMPSRLVRRDPETQFVARRERVLDRRWQQIPLDMITSIGLSNFLDFGHAECIFAAPKGSKPHFKEQLESLQLLRKEGILEPE